MFQDSYVLCIYVMNILSTFHISWYLAIVHKDIIISLFNPCLLFSGLQLLIFFFHYWMINRSGYFDFRRKQWIQLSRSKTTQRSETTGSAENWSPSLEGQTLSVEWTAGWHRASYANDSLKSYVFFFFGTILILW